MTRVTVRLTPRASRDAIAGFDERGRLLVRVTAAPVDGAANAACLRLVAKALGIAPSRVALVGGRRSRDKVLEVPVGGRAAGGRVGRSSQRTGARVRIAPWLSMASPHSPGLPERRQPESLAFPGCRPVRIPREAIADYEGRIEYWDAATETAMVCEPVSTYHERPGQRLAGLLTLIAQTRGSPIETFGAADLLLRDEHGGYFRILEADQTVYLHPRATRPEGPAIEVGSDALPDVVLEVDNTTDVRRGKLALYESWGFPEVWVEVPDTPSPSRPAGLRAGLTIHVLGDRGFRTQPGSRTFPGWTAQEIHRALNEAESSDATMAALRRVGRSLGAAEGTGPDDDPLLRAERTEGRVEGRRETESEAVLQIFRARGLTVSAALSRRVAELAGMPTAALVQAALACRDEADFLRLARERQRR